MGVCEIDIQKTCINSEGILVRTKKNGAETSSAFYKTREGFYDKTGKIILMK
jgi:hypothetical protein